MPPKVDRPSSAEPPMQTVGILFSQSPPFSPVQRSSTNCLYQLPHNKKNRPDGSGRYWKPFMRVRDTFSELVTVQQKVLSPVTLQPITSPKENHPRPGVRRPSLNDQPGPRVPFGCETVSGGQLSPKRVATRRKRPWETLLDAARNKGCKRTDRIPYESNTLNLFAERIVQCCVKQRLGLQANG